MKKRRLKILEREPKPVIICGNDRTSIKPGVSRDAQKKMQRMEQSQRLALAKSSRIFLD